VLEFSTVCHSRKSPLLAMHIKYHPRRYTPQQAQNLRFVPTQTIIRKYRHQPSRVLQLHQPNFFVFLLSTLHRSHNVGAFFVVTYSLCVDRRIVNTRKGTCEEVGNPRLLVFWRRRRRKCLSRGWSRGSTPAGVTAIVALKIDLPFLGLPIFRRLELLLWIELRIFCCPAPPHDACRISNFFPPWLLSERTGLDFLGSCVLKCYWKFCMYFWHLSMHFW
jgi:hypothetical protein